ncbi:MAG: isoaspartyl peptidase/L-asparaginase family protein [Myxococcota bacterium]
MPTQHSLADHFWADDVILAVHGGAGAMCRTKMSPEKEAAFRAGLLEALNVGAEVLKAGGEALDAVEKAIISLEECPHFNAGKGAVLTGEGWAELDASLMRGKDRRAGAVAGLTIVRNPIKLARVVLEETPYVLLMGQGAEQLATALDLELVSQHFFLTPERWEQLKEAQEHEALLLAKIKQEYAEADAAAAAAAALAAEAAQVEPSSPEHIRHKMGTVGAVALDNHGHLAAGTSTGGMCNKRFGRVGDTPLVGSGVFAWDETCAVSCTGHGEYFIQGVIAHDVSIRMELLGCSVWEAAEAAIFGRLASLKGTGGLIALDRLGRLAMPYNTSGLHRAYLRRDGSYGVQIWED